MNKLQNQESPLSGHIIHFTLVNYRSSTLLSTLENFSKRIPEITSSYKQIKAWSIYPPAAFFHRLEIAYMGLLNATHLLRTTYSDANIVLVILEKALRRKRIRCSGYELDQCDVSDQVSLVSPELPTTTDIN